MQRGLWYIMRDTCKERKQRPWYSRIGLSLYFFTYQDRETQSMGDEGIKDNDREKEENLLVTGMIFRATVKEGPKAKNAQIPTAAWVLML